MGRTAMRLAISVAMAIVLGFGGAVLVGEVTAWMGTVGNALATSAAYVCVSVGVLVAPWTRARRLRVTRGAIVVTAAVVVLGTIADLADGADGAVRLAAGVPFAVILVVAATAAAYNASAAVARAVDRA